MRRLKLFILTRKMGRTEWGILFIALAVVYGITFYEIYVRNH